MRASVALGTVVDVGMRVAVAVAVFGGASVGVAVGGGVGVNIATVAVGIVRRGKKLNRP